jgi:putative flavoprotein involved in K+ transport
MGILDDSADAVYNIEVSREQSSLQLVGRSDHASIDLAMLQSQGVHIVGRLVAASHHAVRFADDLVATTAAADVKLATLLRRIDQFAERLDDGRTVPPAPEFEPLFRRFTRGRTTMDLGRAKIDTVVWATGYRRQYPWLRVPGVLDANGEIRHRAGVLPIPGLYVIGLQFQSRRNSSFIDGVGHDARALSAHLAGYLARDNRQNARAS